ncbi:hypothetical protein D3C87_2042410 [compost metagenome]
MLGVVTEWMIVPDLRLNLKIVTKVFVHLTKLKEEFRLVLENVPKQEEKILD